MKGRVFQRFLRVLFVSLGVVVIPVVIQSVQSQEFSELVGPGVTSVVVALVLAVDKLVRDKFGSWGGLIGKVFRDYYND